MSPDDAKLVIRRFIDEVINGRNLDAAGDFVAGNVVEQVPFPGQGPGLEGLRDVLRALFVAFPDMHWTIDEQLGEADKVLTRFTWTATQKGQFFGAPASGKQVSVWGMVIDRLEDGRIKETRILMDMFGLMRQIGA
jgi:steroid delta-isomerase-like uncharacterized protein